MSKYIITTTPLDEVDLDEGQDTLDNIVVCGSAREACRIARELASRSNMDFLVLRAEAMAVYKGKL